MEKLTAQQAKMVLEYFAAQAAEDAPADGPFEDYAKHMWMTRFQTSLTVERQLPEYHWDELVTAMTNLQSFDRDAGAYLHSIGVKDTETFRHYEEIYLNDQVSFSIDNCWNNSGA